MLRRSYVGNMVKEYRRLIRESQWKGSILTEGQKKLRERDRQTSGEVAG